MNDRLDNCLDWVKKKKVQRDLLLDQKESLLKEIKRIKNDREILVKVIALFGEIGLKQRELLGNRVESIMTYGVRSVFCSDDNFKIEISEKRSYPTMDFVIERDGKGRAILDGDGGGLADICGFLLQLLVITLLKDRVRPFLFIDEALVHLSEEYRESMADLIKELANKVGLQLVFITQQREYVECADVAYLAELGDDGFTRLEKIR